MIHLIKHTIKKHRWLSALLSGKIRKTHRGVSIVSSILGFTLLGVSTVGLATYMGNFQQVQVHYEKQSEMHSLHTGLHSSMKQILFAVNLKASSATSVSNDPKGKVNGICSLINKNIQYNNIADLYSDTLKIQKSKITPGASTPEYITDPRWEYFIQATGDWEKTPDSDCSGSSSQQKNGFEDSFTADILNQCFKLKDSVNSNKAKAYARLTITPKHLLTRDKIDSSSSDTMPIDEITYELKTVVSQRLVSGSEEATQWNVSQATNLLWIAEVLECAVCDPSGSKCRSVRLAPGGIGSSRLTKDLFYHSSASSKKMCEALSVSHVSKTINQSMEVSQDGILRADPDNQIAMSCISNIFKCKNLSHSQRFAPNHFDPTLRLGFELNLDTLMPSNIDEIKVNITNGSSSPLSPGTAFITSHNTSYPGQKSNPLKVFSYSKTSTDQLGTWPLLPGGNYYTMHATNQLASGSVCENVCVSPHTYHPELEVKWNSRGGVACPKSGTAQKIKLDGQSGRELASIGCTTCYAKSCHGYGNNTFGPVGQTPKEPRDGNIPECILHQQTSTHLPAVKVKNLPLPGKQLLLGKDGKLHDTSPKANTKTACFINGQYRFVKPQYGGTPAVTIGQQAQACYRSAYQQIKKGDQKTKGALAHFAVAYDQSIHNVKTKLNRLPTMASNQTQYELYNSASQGLFITPEKELQHLSVSQSGEGGYVIVNYQTDKAGMVLDGWIPMDTYDIQSSTPSNKVGWAYFYREPFSSTSFADASSVAKAGSSKCTCTQAGYLLDGNQCCKPATPAVCVTGKLHNGKCVEEVCDNNGDVHNHCEIETCTGSSNCTCEEGWTLSSSGTTCEKHTYGGSSCDHLTSQHTSISGWQHSGLINAQNLGFDPSTAFVDRSSRVYAHPGSFYLHTVPASQSGNTIQALSCYMGNFGSIGNCENGYLIFPPAYNQIHKTSFNRDKRVISGLHPGTYCLSNQVYYDSNQNEIQGSLSYSSTSLPVTMVAGTSPRPISTVRKPASCSRTCTTQTGTKTRSIIADPLPGTAKSCVAQTCQSANAKDRDNILRRKRPARPVLVELPKGSANVDYPHSASPASKRASDASLLLTHHIHYKGIRKIKNNTSGNQYHYLCRRISDTGPIEEQFVLSQIKGATFQLGHTSCPTGYAFLPPDTSELFVAALHAVAPNHPRYPFPNPFNFQDGIPFRRYQDRQVSFRYADMNNSDYKLSYKLDNSFFFHHAHEDLFDTPVAPNKKRKVLAPVRSAWLGLKAIHSGTANTKKSSEWYYPLDHLSHIDSNGIYSLTGNPTNIISALNNNTVNQSDTHNTNNPANINIGVIGNSGVPMKKSELQKDVSHIQLVNQLTMACRFSSDEKIARFYKAPIFRGTHNNWPGTTPQNSCKSKEASTSPIYGIYGGIQTAKRMGASISGNLKPLTATDWSELLKGVRAAHPLYQVTKNPNPLVQNQKKFCTEWRKEKLRRHVGKCMIAKFNTHGIEKTTECRNTNKSTVCEVMREALRKDIKDAKTALNELNAKKDQTTRCEAQKSQCVTKCNARNTSIDTCSRATCPSGKVKSASSCPAKTASCSSHCSCGTKTVAQWQTDIDTLKDKIDCLESAQAMTGCEAGLDVTKVLQNFTIQPTVKASSCSGVYTASYNSDIKDERCWSADKKTPKPTYKASYSGHRSGLNVSGHTVSANYWGSCALSANMDLEKLDVNGCGDYQLMANIGDNDLCNDETGLTLLVTL